MDNYDSGYYKAILDVFNFIDRKDEMVGHCKSARKYNILIKNLLRKILSSRGGDETFKEYGGYVGIKVSKELEVVEILKK